MQDSLQCSENYIYLRIIYNIRYTAFSVLFLVKGILGLRVSSYFHPILCKYELILYSIYKNILIGDSKKNRRNEFITS